MNKYVEILVKNKDKSIINMLKIVNDKSKSNNLGSVKYTSVTI